jgi:hypothetical protein
MRHKGRICYTGRRHDFKRLLGQKFKTLIKQPNQPGNLEEMVLYNNSTSPRLDFTFRTLAPGGSLASNNEEAPAADPQLTAGRIGAEEGRAGNSAAQINTCELRVQTLAALPEISCGARALTDAAKLLLNVPFKQMRQHSAYF